MAANLPRARNVHYWKMLVSSAVKNVTENTNLCVIVMCKEQSQVVY
jgi:hypothetical protein